MANKSLWWMLSGAEAAGIMFDVEALLKVLDKLSTDVLYHDELFKGDDSNLWRGLNLVAGYPDRFFRMIGPNDSLHSAVNEFAYAAPVERPVIPETCVVLTTSDGRYGTAYAV